MNIHLDVAAAKQPRALFEDPEALLPLPVQVTNMGCAVQTVQTVQNHQEDDEITGQRKQEDTLGDLEDKPQKCKSFHSTRSTSASESSWALFRLSRKGSDGSAATSKGSDNCAGHSLSFSSEASARCFAKKQMRQQKRREAVAMFLEMHGFKDVAKPRRPVSSMIFQTEDFYPIHVAAKSANVLMIRALCAEGANPEQKTNLGRTAMDIARDENRRGSHQEVLEILARKVNVISFRAFHKMASSATRGRVTR